MLLVAACPALWCYLDVRCRHVAAVSTGLQQMYLLSAGGEAQLAHLSASCMLRTRLMCSAVRNNLLMCLQHHRQAATLCWRGKVQHALTLHSGTPIC